MHRLGLLYADLGRLNKAEKMYLRALQGYKKAWGPEHTSTLRTVYYLGHLYQDRCHSIAQQESTVLLPDANPEAKLGSGFPRDMDALEGLCAKFPTTSRFSCLGRVLIWARRDRNAIITLQQQIASIYNSYGVDLNSTTEKSIYRSCKDFDLCHSYHERYGAKKLPMSSESDCQNHVFILVPVSDSY
jgi:hypothetical protein